MGPASSGRAVAAAVPDQQVGQGDRLSAVPSAGIGRSHPRLSPTPVIDEPRCAPGLPAATPVTASPRRRDPADGQVFQPGQGRRGAPGARLSSCELAVTGRRGLACLTGSRADHPQASAAAHPFRSPAAGPALHVRLDLPPGRSLTPARPRRRSARYGRRDPDVRRTLALAPARAHFADLRGVYPRG